MRHRFVGIFLKNISIKEGEATVHENQATELLKTDIVSAVLDYSRRSGRSL
jgi:hypothetical protein